MTDRRLESIETQIAALQVQVRSLLKSKKTKSGSKPKTAARRGWGDHHSGKAKPKPKLLVIDHQVSRYGRLANAALHDVRVVEFDSSNDTLDDFVRMLREAHHENTAPFKSIAIAQHGPGKSIAFAQDGFDPQESIWKWTADLGIDLTYDVNEVIRDLAPIIEILVSILKKTSKAHINFLACNLASYRRDLVPSLQNLYGVDFRASTDATGNEFDGGNWYMETDQNYDVSIDYLDEDSVKQYHETMAGGQKAGGMSRKGVPEKVPLKDQSDLTPFWRSQQDLQFYSGLFDKLEAKNCGMTAANVEEALNKFGKREKEVHFSLLEKIPVYRITWNNHRDHKEIIYKKERQKPFREKYAELLRDKAPSNEKKRTEKTSNKKAGKATESSDQQAEGVVCYSAVLRVGTTMDFIAWPKTVGEESGHGLDLPRTDSHLLLAARIVDDKPDLKSRYIGCNIKVGASTKGKKPEVLEVTDFKADINIGATTADGDLKGDLKYVLVSNEVEVPNTDMKIAADPRIKKFVDDKYNSYEEDYAEAENHNLNRKYYNIGIALEKKYDKLLKKAGSKENYDGNWSNVARGYHEAEKTIAWQYKRVIEDIVEGIVTQRHPDPIKQGQIHFVAKGTRAKRRNARLLEGEALALNGHPFDPKLKERKTQYHDRPGLEVCVRLANNRR